MAGLKRNKGGRTRERKKVRCACLILGCVLGRFAVSGAELLWDWVKAGGARARDEGGREREMGDKGQELRFTLRPPPPNRGLERAATMRACQDWSRPGTTRVRLLSGSLPWTIQ